MSPLPKHLRPRWRYLAVGLETWPDASFDRREFQDAVWRGARALLGDAGSADLDLRVVQFHREDATGEAIVRTRRGETDRARTALACVDAVGDDDLGLQIRGISGTVRACEEKYIGRRPEGPDQRQVVFEDADRDAVVRGSLIDVRVDGSFSGATELDLQ